MTLEKEGRGPRVLVVRRRYLGDTILTEPFVRNLRAHWPEAHVAMVVDTPYVEALADVPELDEILELPAGTMPRWTRLRRWGALLGKVARRRWDVVFDFARNERAQLLVMLSRARRRAVLVFPETHLHRRGLYTDVVEIGSGEAAALHTVDHHNRLLGAVGVPTPFRVPVLRVAEGPRRTAALLLAEAGVAAARDGSRDGTDGPLLLVHPGSGAPARRWPPADFARVADAAVHCRRARVVVLGGRGEEDLAKAVAEAMTETATTVAAPGSVRVLGALLAEADLLLCNDSGPMHLAAAVGTPVCALFGPESVARWLPLGDAGHRTFQAELPCGDACVNAGVCVPDDPMKAFCIRRIPAEEVVGAACAQLEAGEEAAQGRPTSAAD